VERPPGADDGRPERKISMKIPNIAINRYWSTQSVREVCIKNNLYTSGDCEEYDKMLSSVKSLYPSAENLYFVASDILSHSKNQTITNIMFILENEAVTTTFRIDGRDDI